jgi:hypothetical protein
VLCNVINGAEKIHPNINEIYRKSSCKAWEMLLSKGSSFWKNLEWELGGKELWNHIEKYNPIILSATAKEFPMEIPETGKRQWLQKNISIDVADNAIIVNNKRFKQRYSGKNKILIDDEIININEWEEKGGIGIHHTNTWKTVEILNEI